MRENKINITRHSLAHILAMAVLKKFPKAKLGMGPVIKNGFYYDFLLQEKLSDYDLLKLEKEIMEKSGWIKFLGTNIDKWMKEERDKKGEDNEE